MDNSTWCRIITLENGADVLLTKTFEEEGGENKEDLFKVEVTCDFKYGRGSISLGFTDEVKRDECFAAYTVAQAMKVYEEIGKYYPED